ncbi:hypothetical protein [Photobacterium sp.]|uniref:hypothetical protein n=1 Tax=Photobacterium sp. TaxID=660 RepID=UPI00299EF9EB|nr:hypothetical protein [Photobacterium sp.]
MERDFETEIVGVEEQLRVAMLHSDMNALSNLLAEGLVFIRLDQPIEAHQQLHLPRNLTGPE